MNVKRCDQCLTVGERGTTSEWLQVTIPSHFKPQEGSPGYGTIYGPVQLDLCSTRCLADWTALRERAA